MKFDFWDTYSIRARFSVSVILFSPIAITMFLCFEEIFSFASSSVVIALLLALANYIPSCQRRKGKKIAFVNYAAQYLRAEDSTIDAVSKNRYYRILARANKSFKPLLEQNDAKKSDAFYDSIVLYLRNHTRDNHLVQEENINCSFCKNLLASKRYGIIICMVLCLGIGWYSWYKYEALASVPLEFYLACVINFCMLIFWIFGVKEKIVTDSARIYAKTLIRAIDNL